MKHLLVRVLYALLLGLPAGALAELPSTTYVEIVTGGADADTPLPMVVALHGLGDRPEAFGRLWLQLPMAARVILPQGKRPWGRGHTWFAIERPPGPKMVADMRDSTTRLAALVRRLVIARPTRGKPVVTGFSQGGMLSFALAAAHPELFAAAVPVAGALPETMHPTTKAALPVEAIHGGADTRVPAKGAQASVAAFTRAGYPAELRITPGVGHTISPAMRQDLFDTLARRLPQ